MVNDMNTHILKAGLVTLALAAPAFAASGIDGLLKHYGQQGGQAFSADRGKAFWTRELVTDKGEKMNCATCHGADLAKPGKHYKSGKVIEPMAPTANHERYTDLEKVEKWFTRNCKQVLSRECTAQEKGDVLLYLSRF